MSYRENYAKEKLYDGIRTLVGAGDLEDRLMKAAGFLIQIEDTDIPDRHKSEFARLKSTLFQPPSSHRSHFVLRQISHDDARTAATRYLDLYRALSLFQEGKGSN
jgi:hypothetical protein